MALADRLQARGHAVGILLRGYGRCGSGFAVVGERGGGQGSWQTVGDEAVLIAERLPNVPVVVGGDRFGAGRELLRRMRVDVLLLDDGFQHRQLHRDLDLVMVDAMDPFGGGRLLPRGRLRELPSALRRAQAVILSHTDQASDLSNLRQRLREIAPDIPLVLSRHRPIRLAELGRAGELALGELAGRQVLAVCGIAGPEGFHRALRDLGAVLAGIMVFPDHYAYTWDDILRVQKVAEGVGAELIVTTEKDAVRIPAVKPGTTLAGRMLVLGVDLEITEGQDALEDLFKRCMEKACG
jgi:tetraacyldisaccharide 4'-kinase